MHRARLPLIVLLLTTALTPSAAAPSAPPDPYVDKGACPFECCTYRDWKTTKAITLLDRPKGVTAVGHIAAGSTVHAITGEVIAKPMRVVAKQDYAGSPIAKGDVFYVLHYEGEGSYLVWFRGKTLSLELLQSGVTLEGPPADGTWWVNIRAAGGKSGWVLDNGQFENQDACG